MQTIYFSEEHEMLREQLRRFVEAEIKPHGEAWEAAGMMPREVLRRMGELGFLGIRYPEKYGGSDMDIFGAVVLAEELERSTFGGVNACITVHTDMASPHLFNAGNQDQLDKYLPRIEANGCLGGARGGTARPWRVPRSAPPTGRPPGAA